jgi:hypothetical protein
MEKDVNYMIVSIQGSKHNRVIAQCKTLKSAKACFVRLMWQLRRYDHYKHGEFRIYDVLNDEYIVWKYSR